MPYRRLPKTDLARLTSLRKIVELENAGLDAVPINFRLLSQAKTYLNAFENLVSQYNETFEQQVSSSKEYQQKVRDARMYISHFIQVLNFAVQRREIKKETKELYKLDPDDFTVPDLTSDAALVEWGENIIKGEQERIANKGVPITYPTIARVKVFYDIFNDARISQKTRQTSTARTQQRVVKLRMEVDELILQIWDAVEQHYAHLLPYERYMACTRCGVIYYYRSREPKLTPKVDEDIRAAQAATLTIDFSDSEE